LSFGILGKVKITDSSRSSGLDSERFYQPAGSVSLQYRLCAVSHWIGKERTHIPWKRSYRVSASAWALLHECWSRIRLTGSSWTLWFSIGTRSIRFPTFCSICCSPA